MVKGPRTEAEDWLRAARMQSQISDISFELHMVRLFAEQAGCSLEDIGTSEEELTNLRIAGYKAQAKMYLRGARQPCFGELDYRKAVSYLAFEIGQVRDYVAQAACSLEDIGTSEEELDRLLKAAYKSLAQKMLEDVRRNHTGISVNTQIWQIIKYAEQAGCSLEDIGTNEKELIPIFFPAGCSFAPKNGEAISEESLNIFRGSKGRISEACKLCGVSDCKIGSYIRNCPP